MTTPLLQTKDLQLAFGAVVVADHINFSLTEGERLAVIGQNGAGKSTILDALSFGHQIMDSFLHLVYELEPFLLCRQFYE